MRYADAIVEAVEMSMNQKIPVYVYVLPDEDKNGPFAVTFTHKERSIKITAEDT